MLFVHERITKMNWEEIRKLKWWKTRHELDQEDVNILLTLSNSSNLFMKEKEVLKAIPAERLDRLMELGLIEGRTTVSGQVLYALKERLEAYA